jgi:hypothetical protein
VGAALTASLCAGLVKVPRNAYIYLKQTATECHWSIKYALFFDELVYPLSAEQALVGK